MNLLYVDESGDTGRTGADHLVLGAAALFEGKWRQLREALQGLLKHDFPDASKRPHEIHASHVRSGKGLFGICEERGSGIDKVVSEVELHRLPAPLFETPEGFTRSVIFAHKPLRDMSKADRIRACYLHACLRYVTRQPMTNRSLRERFGIAEQNASAASRLLNEAVAADSIIVEDMAVGTRARAYLPYWAAARSHPEEIA